VEVVVAENLSKRFGFTWALRGVSLKLGGGLHLLLGPNGSGKTTFLKLAVGMLKPTSGLVRVLGLDPWRDYAKLSAKLSFAFEGLPLPWWVSGKAFIERLASMRGSILLRSVAEELGVTAYWHRLPFTYSSGMAKRLLLLLALGFEAEVYVLDEPFTLLDREAVRLVSRKLRELAESGKTILVATHYVPKELEDAISTLTRFENGEIIAHVTGDEAGNYLKQAS